MADRTPIKLLRNARVYAPASLGVRDVLVIGEQISAIEHRLPSLPTSLPHEVVDLAGQSLVPGLVDAHVHLTGGGGESGPGSRVPPLALSQLTRAGVTTCVGVLGTDGTTRTMRDLVASTLGIRAHGLSAYCYTGSYQYPVPTLTGSIRDDIVFVDPIIGVGELALSDHRSSQLTLDELLRVASDAYTAGLMSNKAGLVHLHMGDGPRQFALIEEALEVAELPARVYHPTHVNRHKSLFSAAVELAQRGVTVDVTAFPEADGGFLAVEAIDRWLKSDQPVERLTCSSDGGGCMPTFDDDGELLRMGVGLSDVLGDTIQALLALGYPLEKFLPIFTRNVARVLRLPTKGRLGPGLDADLVTLTPEGRIRSVMSRGQWLVQDGDVIRHGPFEDQRKATL